MRLARMKFKLKLELTLNLNLKQNLKLMRQVAFVELWNCGRDGRRRVK